MAIPVICPGCRKSFKVSDKFAGKSGPCPKCKTVIRIAEKTPEVTVHGATQFADGGRSVTGELLTKPIARRQTKLEPVAATIIVASTLAVVAMAFVGGRSGWFQGELLLAIGLLLVSPPLVIAAYSFLRDDELEPYRGIALYVRSAICAVGYVVLWGVFGYLSGIGLTAELWGWLVVAPSMLCLGGLIAPVCLDLDFGSGFFHYAFYVLATVLLRWTAGLGWIWEIPELPVM